MTSGIKKVVVYFNHGRRVVLEGLEFRLDLDVVNGRKFFLLHMNDMPKPVAQKPNPKARKRTPSKKTVVRAKKTRKRG